jgi:hypothetical protein
MTHRKACNTIVHMQIHTRFNRSCPQPETNRSRQHSRQHRQIISIMDILIILKIISPQGFIKIPHKWYVQQHCMEKTKVD